MSHTIEPSAGATTLTRLAEAEAHVSGVCFKHGPPARIGIELEWLLTDPTDPTRAPTVADFLGCLGAHAPRTLRPDGPARPLSRGSTVTVEPGGQIELSSAPARSTARLIEAMTADIAELQTLLTPSGFVLSDDSFDRVRAPHRIVDTPRYRAMEQAFDRVSPAGRAMMCSTAALQVCLDLGTEEQAPRRWLAAHLAGPTLAAAFANTPGPDGSRSPRLATWWALDPPRTEPPPPGALDQPESYLQRVLDTRVLAVRNDSENWSADIGTFADWIRAAQRGERPAPTTFDLDLHLSMIFPPVRPQGYLELRYLDAQPGRGWVAVLAVLDSLFATDESVEAVVDACRPAGLRWAEATRVGLQDDVLARSAGQLLAIAEAGLDRLGLTDDDEQLARSTARLALGARSSDTATEKGNA